MDEHERTSSAASDWIPDAHLAEHEPIEGGAGGPPDGMPPARDRDRWRSSRRRVVASAAVALAVAGGIGVGLLASRGGGDGTGGGGSAAEPRARASRGDPPARTRSEEPLIPVVRRATNLGPSETALLAAAAQSRDARADARAQRDESVAGEPSLNLAPINSEDRYRYLRRTSAVAVILTGLGGPTRRIHSTATLEAATPQLRGRLDRLAAIVAGLETSRYLRSQRLNVLITTAIARFDRVVDSGDVAALRGAGERLVRVGGVVADELERAAAAATAGDPMRARRLLTSVDRRLGDIATAVKWVVS